jgi:hypothetical protein
VIQCPLAKQIRIALAFFCKLNDFPGDYPNDGIVSIPQVEGCARHFERDAHDAPGLRIEFEAV